MPINLCTVIGSLFMLILAFVAVARLEFRRAGESTLVNVVEKRGNLIVEVLY